MGPAASLTGRQLGQDFSPNAEGWRMYHGERVPGFPAHPHCGFETVTIVTRGLVDHSDSLGAAGRFGHGDVQWMTAGRGVQHSEMFPLLHRDKPNPLELFQIWLNLPRAAKQAEPHFAMLWADTIPQVEVQDTHGAKTTVRVIAGTYQQVKAPDPAPSSWAATLENEVAIWLITLEPAARWVLPACRTVVNRSLFFYAGQELQVGEQSIHQHCAIELDGRHQVELQNGKTESHLVLLQGKPINEPVVQHGPFVGNSMNDIQQAFSVYQHTQFGGWPWPSYDHVHERTRGRFARYPDGTEIHKEA
jgi:hypothetical protein